MDDLISRQAALKGFAEHSNGWCYINALPSAEPTVSKMEQVEDCISRQTAIDALGDMPMSWADTDAEIQAQEDWKQHREALFKLPTAEPERKKNIIQHFHDYQVEWLTSHCDLELEPSIESYVVRLLHDTANCFMMEIDRGEQNE